MIPLGIFCCAWLTNIAHEALSTAIFLRDSLNKDPKTASPVYEKIVQVIQKNTRQIVKEQ